MSRPRRSIRQVPARRQRLSGWPPPVSNMSNADGGTPETRRDQADVFQADIAFPAFDASEIASVQADLLGEMLLTHPPALSEESDPSPELTFDVFV